MLKMKSIVAAAALMTAPMVALAGDGLSFSGYADLSIQDNSRDYTVAGGIGAEDSFTVNQISLTATKAPVDGFSGLVQIVGGEDAAVLAGHGGAPADVQIAQGYFQYNSGALTVTGGKFFTLAGSEVFASTGNAQITRSILFGFQPLNLTGVRASYAVSDAFSITGGAMNSIFGLTQDNNEQKTLELGLALTPSKNFSLALTAYSGTENPAGGLNTSLIDLVANWQVSEAFSLGVNFDTGKIETSPTTDFEGSGIAVYGGLALSDTCKLSLRAESVKFEVTGAGEIKPTEVTLTYGHAASKNFDFLAEVRLDDSDTTGTSADKSTTIAVKGIFKF